MTFKSGNKPQLTADQLLTHKRLMEDFPFYAANILKVAPAKGGEPIPFHLNPAQWYMHAMIEKQKSECQFVRAINLKARRLGFSTYVGGRYYHKASTTPGMRVFILSHHSRTTQVLFNMVKKYHNLAPAPAQPDLATANVYQLVLDKLGSEYAVGTAGSAEIGRGDTIQLFHGSEVAFWENTNKITTGVLQAVELLPGTEMILESTANGKGNMFYRMCMDALYNIGDFILIFAPWYWHPAYSRPAPPPDQFRLDQEELEIMNTPINIPTPLKGLPLIPSKLTRDQMYWRRMKIIDFRKEADPLSRFKQEYPSTVEEAFQNTGKSLILPQKVSQARKAVIEDFNAPLLMGCDLARNGTQIVFAYRRGRVWENYEIVPHVEVSDNPTNILTALIAKRLEQKNIQKCFIDYGHGHGVFDNLRSLGYNDIVQLVHFSERPLEPEIYVNKRSEMIIAVRDWLHEGGVSIPDSEEIEVNLLSIPDWKENARGLKFIIEKKKIEEEAGIDLGIFDAFALTFAYPVARNLGALANIKKVKQLKNKLSSGLKTRKRVQSMKSGRQEISFNWGGL